MPRRQSQYVEEVREGSVSKRIESSNGSGKGYSEQSNYQQNWDSPTSATSQRESPVHPGREDNLAIPPVSRGFRERREDRHCPELCRAPGLADRLLAGPQGLGSRGCRGSYLDAAGEVAGVDDPAGAAWAALDSSGG